MKCSSRWTIKSQTIATQSLVLRVLNSKQQAIANGDDEGDEDLNPDFMGGGHLSDDLCHRLITHGYCHGMNCKLMGVGVCYRSVE